MAISQRLFGVSYFETNQLGDSLGLTIYVAGFNPSVVTIIPGMEKMEKVAYV